MQHLTRLQDIAGRYQGFIIDLWGVVHDGVRPYPGAVRCLEALRAAGKPVILLSNAPRRAEAAQASMRTMGIDDSLYTGLLTSGEAVHLALRDRTDPWFAALGQNVYHLGPERDRNVLAGLDLTLVAEPAAAAFVLNTGPDDEADPTDIAAFEPVLRACVQSRLPMICANPDLDVIRGGVRVLCAGALAVRYRQLGGDVRAIGKPDPAIYRPVVDRLGLSRPNILAIGDSLRTDIAGAAAAGIDACWILGGIHAVEAADPSKAEELAQRAALRPVVTLQTLTW